MMLTEISTFGWFKDSAPDPDLLAIATFGWYISGVIPSVGYRVAFAGAGFIQTVDYGVAGP